MLSKSTGPLLLTLNWIAVSLTKRSPGHWRHLTTEFIFKGWQGRKLLASFFPRAFFFLWTLTQYVNFQVPFQVTVSIHSSELLINCCISLIHHLLVTYRSSTYLRLFFSDGKPILFLFEKWSIQNLNLTINEVTAFPTPPNLVILITC